MNTPKIASPDLSPSASAALDEALLTLAIMSVWVEQQCDAEEISIDDLWQGFALLHGQAEAMLIGLRNRIGERAQ